MMRRSSGKWAIRIFSGLQGQWLMMGPGGVEKEKRNTFNYLYQDNILHKENQPQSNIDTSGTCLFKVQTMEIVFFFLFFFPTKSALLEVDPNS